MKRFASSLFIYVLFTVLLTTQSSCNSHDKIVLVYAKGKIEVNQSKTTITIKDGTGQAEEKLYYNSGAAVNITVQEKDKQAQLSVPEDGVYVLNAKEDTIIGTAIHYVRPGDKKNLTTQKDLQKDIDSLQSLISFKTNIPTKKAIILLPFTLAKVTTNTQAIIIGPFHKVPALTADNGVMPEVYRFYSIKSLRSTLNELKELTINAKE